MTSKGCETAMPIVQAAIMRAVSVLGDTPRDLHSGGRRPDKKHHSTSALLFPATLRRHRKVRGQDERQPKFRGTMDRSIQLKRNVSFCYNSVRHESGRGFLMDGFLWGTQC